MTNGEIAILAGVYTLSILCVMALFAIGNMLLKKTRARLPSTTRASWPAVTLALFAVLAGLVGNIVADPEYVKIFGVYFAAAIVVIALMFLRIEILKLALFVPRSVLDKVRAFNVWVDGRVHSKIDAINSQRMIYPTKGDSLPMLNRAALYVLRNENTRNLLVVFAFEREDQVPADLAGHLETVDRLYPQLRIDHPRGEGRLRPGDDRGAVAPPRRPQELHVHRHARRPLPPQHRRPRRRAPHHVSAAGCREYTRICPP
ncbi:MAG: hypothetical protein CVU56_20305 [Deltaproteobacteria bacterium HGW-Deltaproteobacteria-14]|nr:MAG: hypothetical protein CVU56_20305 [Deltaproteobacteria bacterium HGW-Deltaproteobacteria-14]